MDKQQLDQLLEQADHPVTDSETRAAVQLLHALQQDQTPEPDQAYWNQFNARLQSRLEASRKPRFAWTRGFAWLGMAAAALLMMGLLGVFDRTAPSLEDLSDEDLALISELYLDEVQDGDALNLAESDLSDLLGGLAEDLLMGEEWLSVDPDDLASDWNKEG